MTIAFHRLKEAWVREYFKEEIAMIKTADIIQEWMEESLEKGRKEGLQQGMREGLLSAISLGLDLRFGIKGLKLYERIGQTSSVEKLTAIKDAIRAAKDLEEIESLL
jgi:flagellar biosynthesis/type III secretory pathway protein FliH